MSGIKSQFKLGAHTWRPKDEQIRALEIRERMLKEEEARKIREIQTRMHTVEEMKKMESKSREVAQLAATQEALVRRKSLNLREKDALTLRQRELERMNDLDRAGRLKIDNDLLRLENLKREEERKRAMLEAEMRIKTLKQIQLERALSEVELRDLRAQQARVEELEALVRASHMRHSSALGMPTPRVRTTSIGGLGLSPRMTSISTIETQTIAPTTPLQKGLPVGALTPRIGGLAPAMGRPRARSFGASMSRAASISGGMSPVLGGRSPTVVSRTSVSRSPSVSGRRSPRSEAALIESQRLAAELESARKAALLAAEKLKHERIHNAALNAAQKALLQKKEDSLRAQERELERKKEAELNRRTVELDRRATALENRERRTSFGTSLGRSPSMGAHRSSSGLSPTMRTLGLGGNTPGPRGGARSVGNSPNMRAYSEFDGGMPIPHGHHGRDIDAFTDHSPPFEVTNGPLFGGRGGVARKSSYGGGLSRKGSFGGGGRLSRKNSMGGLRAEGGGGWNSASPMDPALHNFPSGRDYGDEEEFGLYGTLQPDDGRRILKSLGKLEGRSGLGGASFYQDGGDDPEQTEAINDLIMRARGYGANAIVGLRVDVDVRGGVVAVGEAVVIR